MNVRRDAFFANEAEQQATHQPRATTNLPCATKLYLLCTSSRLRCMISDVSGPVLSSRLGANSAMTVLLAGG